MERQERMFGDLKTIAQQATSLRHTKVIPQVLARIQARIQVDTLVQDSLSKQDSDISREASKHEPPQATVITWEVLNKYPLTVQNHLARIADYVTRGSEFWFCVDHRGLVFKDGPNHPDEQLVGTTLMQYQMASCSDVKQMLNVECQSVIKKVERKEIMFPIPLRVYENGILSKRIPASGNCII